MTITWRVWLQSERPAFKHVSNLRLDFIVSLCVCDTER